MGQNQAKLRGACPDPARCLSGPCPELSGLKLTKFLRNELRIKPQGANVVTEAGGRVPGPKQLNNLENIDFGGLGWVGGGGPPPLGPMSLLRPY